MEGEEGESRLRKLQEEIRKEYNIEIDLETENQEEINQVKENQRYKRGRGEKGNKRTNKIGEGNSEIVSHGTNDQTIKHNYPLLIS